MTHDQPSIDEATESGTPTRARGLAGNRRSTEGCQARSSWRRSGSGSRWICCVATERFPSPTSAFRSGRRSATAVRGRHDGSRTCVHPLQRDSEPFDSRRRGRGDAPVLSRSGAVLVHDFWTTGRVNPDNWPLRRTEIERLFPGCRSGAPGDARTAACASACPTILVPVRVAREAALSPDALVGPDHPRSLTHHGWPDSSRAYEGDAAYRSNQSEKARRAQIFRPWSARCAAWSSIMRVTASGLKKPCLRRLSSDSTSRTNG